MDKLTLKTMINQLIELDDYDIAKAVITLKESKYADALDAQLIETPETGELYQLLFPKRSQVPEPTPPIAVVTPLIEPAVEELPVVTPLINAVSIVEVPKTDTSPLVKTTPAEVYVLKDFKEVTNLKGDLIKPPSSIDVFKKLTKEQKMVLLTLAWAKAPSPSSFIIKHCQRLSCYFQLDQDARWREFYPNNRSKMQSLITNSILKFKKIDLVVETKMSNLNKHSVYSLSSLGISVSRIIANDIRFSLDSTI